MFDLRRDGDVFVLRFDDNENRFSPGFLDGIQDLLDQVEKTEGAKALVTVGTGKFYSNGLDLEWLSAHNDEFEPYLKRVHGLFARLLNLELPTVAAINGHAFAGGAMLALAHDVAVMRTDRGYFCLPEVDLGMSFTPGMNALIQSRLTPAVAHQAMVTGRRYTAGEAQDARIVEYTAEEAEVVPVAVGVAAGLAGKDGVIVGRIRRMLYRQALEALAGPVF